jgi:hypothetical protein
MVTMSGMIVARYILGKERTLMPYCRPESMASTYLDHCPIWRVSVRLCIAPYDDAPGSLHNVMICATGRLERRDLESPQLFVEPFLQFSQSP